MLGCIVAAASGRATRLSESSVFLTNLEDEAKLISTFSILEKILKIKSPDALRKELPSSLGLEAARQWLPQIEGLIEKFSSLPIADFSRQVEASTKLCLAYCQAKVLNPEVATQLSPPMLSALKQRLQECNSYSD